jgi:hypothetical protein
MKRYEAVDHRPGYDRHGKINHMVSSGGYVMVHRPRCMPFVMTIKDWAKLPKEPNEAFSVTNGRVASVEPPPGEPR